MGHFADKGNEPEIEADNRQRCQCRSHSPFENNVHIHQTVFDDGVTERQGNENQRKDGCLHPERGNDAEPIRHRIKEKEWKSPQSGSDDNPLHLLLQGLV